MGYKQDEDGIEIISITSNELLELLRTNKTTIKGEFSTIEYKLIVED